MKLRKPTVFIKINTTGLNPSTDRIIELSMIKYVLNNNGEFEERESGARMFNPGFQMSQEVISVHGIKNEDLSDKPEFSYSAHRILNFIGDCDMIGFGIKNFDILFLRNEFARCGIEFNMSGRMIVDLMEIFTKKEPRNLENAALFYAKKTIENNIEDKTAVLPNIFESMSEMYEDVSSIEQACMITYNGNIPVDIDGAITELNGELVFNVGKYKGMPIGKTCYDDVSYFNWIINKSEFNNETKRIILDCHRKYKTSNEGIIKKQEYYSA